MVIRKSVRSQFAAGCAFGLVGLGFAGVSQAQEPLCNAEVQANPDMRCFIAQVDGAQSVAVNSTPLETRQGTGRAEIVLNLRTLELAYAAEFQGISVEDFTPADFVPSGPTADATRPSGANVPGGGVSLVHFHVGSRGNNGPIPVDILGQNGPAEGVIATEPAMLQMAGAGRVIGRVNLNQMADADGMLLNGVRLGSADEECADVAGTTCAFIPALLSDRTYFNIHTFNNLFGEARGQILLQGAPAPSSEDDRDTEGELNL